MSPYRLCPDRLSRTRLARTLANLDPRRAYAVVRTPADVYLHILSAAQRHDVFEPFDAEARALNDWLTERRAGRDLCRDAWDSFMAEAPFGVAGAEMRTARKSA